MARVVRNLWLIAVLAGAGCSQPAAPSPAETVDVLDFLIGDPSLWPRVGNHYSNQIVDQGRREVCWVKYANPRRFECWRWDDAFVYHATDHALDGDSSASYSFTDGRWLPRHLTGTWTFEATSNAAVWFAPSCEIDASRSGASPYRQRAWLEKGRAAGGDLGIRDTVVLEYAPYEPGSGRSVTEHFYLGRGAGWYEWQREDIDLSFNRRGGPSILMDRSVWCRAPP